MHMPHCSTGDIVFVFVFVLGEGTGEASQQRRHGMTTQVFFLPMRTYHGIDVSLSLIAVGHDPLTFVCGWLASPVPSV